MGKAHKLPYSISDFSCKHPLELVYSDLWGPAFCMWVCFLKRKSEAFQSFLHFKNLTKLQFNIKLKDVQYDAGTEYKPISTFLKQNGIHHRVSCPHTHEQNGSTERKHRPLIYWDHVILIANYIVNRLPTPILKDKYAFEMLYHHKPDYNTLKIFGCTCFPYTRPYNHHKFAYKFVACIFLGYIYIALIIRATNVLIVLLIKIYISEHVLFYENHFYSRDKDSNNSNKSSSTSNSLLAPSVVMPLISYSRLQNNTITPNTDSLDDFSFKNTNTSAKFDPIISTNSNALEPQSPQASNSPSFPTLSPSNSSLKSIGQEQITQPSSPSRSIQNI